MRKGSKVKHILIAGIFACLCMGCISTEKARITAASPVAVISVVSNYDINWDGEGPSLSSSVSSKAGRLFWGAIRKPVDDGQVDISTADIILDEADAILRETIAGSGLTAVVDKDRVINAPAYGQAKLNIRQEKDDNIVAAEGYRLVNSRDKTLAAALSGETGAGSCMSVVFNFTKVVASGVGKNGTMRAQVVMTVIMVTASGKTIYNRTHRVVSEEKIDVRGGSYNEEEFAELLRSAVSDVCYEFIYQYML
jgi:hypothetical protein